MTSLSVDYFRDHHKMIHFFGLGFVQVKMSEDVRYHFYHPQFQGFVETPHDHRYWFRSEVLRGSLENRIWRWGNWEDPSGKRPFNGEKRATVCTPDGSEAEPFPRTRIRCDELTSFTTKAGSGYFMEEDAFHQVFASASEPCVTRLTRGPKTKEFATVLQLDGYPEACPFSKNLAVDALWEIVEACIL